ncbi:MAG: DUF393 domain-containing protein [Fimbriimonadaceae bacterium]|nr:DUF393 domain-containing protein [Chitinophagales bacterium]
MKEDKQHIIFFDGICNLCNNSVQSVIKKDKKNIFKFAALQSDFTKLFFTEKNFQPKVDSIIYWNGDKFYSQSTAVLKIASKLKFPTSLLNILWIIPKFARDAGYKFIAGNRYKWFGKQESCMIPTPELKEKFL